MSVLQRFQHTCRLTRCTKSGNARRASISLAHFKRYQTTTSRNFSETRNRFVRQYPRNFSALSEEDYQPSGKLSQSSEDAPRRINKQIVSCGKKRDWLTILKLHQKKRHEFNAINYSTAMSQLAKIQNVSLRDPRIEDLLEGIYSLLQNNPSIWTIRTKVTILHAIAKMKLNSAAARHSVNLILNEASAIVEDGNPISVSLTAWSVATMELDTPQLFEAIDRHAKHLTRLGNPQTMSNTAHACARVGRRCSAFFHAVDAEAERLVDEGSLQAVSNTFWAFASLQVDCPNLAAAIKTRAKDLVSHGLPQNIAHVAWAYGTMGVECNELFEAIQSNPFSVLDKDVDTQAIAMVAGAFATSKIHGSLFYQAVDHHAGSIVKKALPQEVATILRSMALQKAEAPVFLRQISENGASLVSRGESRNISSIIWSLATLRVDCPELYVAVDKEADRLVQDGSSHSIANFLWGISILGVADSNLFQSFDGRVVDTFVRSCNDQEAVNACYAFAISNKIRRYPDTFAELWSRALKIDWTALPNQGRVQLVQTYLIASNDGFAVVEPNWSSFELMIDTEESRVEQEMSYILASECNFDHERGVSPYPSHDGLDLWAIDCACRDRMIAVEFDGPSHFLRSATSTTSANVEDGPTKAKRRFLASLGWSVVNIPYFQWSEAATHEGKIQLLRTRMEDIMMPKT